MGKTYVVGNFKGGVGKTKTVTMLSYISAVRKNRQTLVIDLDPQGNATSVLAKTGNLTSIDKTITNGFIEGNLENQITPILPNLDLIAANTQFKDLPKILMKKFPDDNTKQISYLRTLIEPLKAKYDAIYLDVPPTISDFSDNAMVSADYCIIILQTQELSLDGAKTYINYMQYLIDNYDINIDILGILPCMLRPGGRVDEKILDDARDMYGDNVLHTIVKHQERLKAYDSEGITLNMTYTGQPDQWDKRAHDLFDDVLTELDAHEQQLN
ncbi:ParA family protein [Apilactobacillus xinyiensis]|uniref:ParA family protein n=1 Tax=Apilactobacillus xinyiensis TaxID=2841032 RepID=UPI003364E94E